MARKKATADAVVMEPVVEEVNVTVETAEPEKKTRTRKAAAPKAEKPAAEKKAPAKRTSKKAAAAEAVVAEAAPAVEVAAEAPAAETPVAAPAEKKAPAKKAAKKPAEVKASVSVQFSGKEYTTEDLVEIAKAVWQYDLGQKPEDFKSVELYVKTEESAVYYVINGDTTGRFGI